MRQGIDSAAPIIFVVDDDESYLNGVTRLLKASGLVYRSYSSATDFLAQRPKDAPGCVLTDLQMPGMNGMELQEELARSENPLPVVFLTGHGDIPTSVTAMRHGAEDFLTKHASREDLLAAVDRALARNERDRLARLRQRDLQSRFARLTPRERQVLTYLLAGKLNKQIAACIGIDERSVKRHRTSLMSKLQVESVAALTQLAVEAQFKEP